MKPTKLFVKPARPGMNLRHPVSGLLPDTGRSWIDDSFTQRRISDGGILIADRNDAPDADEADGEADTKPGTAPTPPRAVTPGPASNVPAAPPSIKS